MDSLNCTTFRTLATLCDTHIKLQLRLYKYTLYRITNLSKKFNQCSKVTSTRRKYSNISVDQKILLCKNIAFHRELF